MSNTMRCFVLIAAVCGSLCGCKSGPTWDWWRIGRSGTPESSPIARSAGPSLPSDLAQQGDPSLVSQNLQTPVVESGGDQFAYGGQNPAYNQSMGSSMAGSTYPNTGSGYAPPGGGSTSGFAGNYSNTGGADPFARGAGASTSMGSAPVQNGYYDPNAYAAPPAQTAMTPGVSEADRYAYNAAPYAGTSGMGTGGSAAGGMASPTPWPPQASTQNTSPSEYGRYGGAAGGGVPVSGNVPVSQVDFGDPARSASMTADYTSGMASSASASSAPYRPGGTSDYTGLESASQVNVAIHQGTQDASPHAGNATAPGTPGGPTYRYGAETPYADTGIGQRY